jgi:hypothetical protein
VYGEPGSRVSGLAVNPGSGEPGFPGNQSTGSLVYRCSGLPVLLLSGLQVFGFPGFPVDL